MNNQYKDFNNIPINGINTDVDERFQPEGTYRFALNFINNTNNENDNFLTNENSTELFHTIQRDCYVIGKCNVSNDEVVLFLVDKNNIQSAIYVFNTINPDFSYYAIPFTDKLGLSKYYRVEATFREIRGCERIVYFTDNYNKPRFINIDHLNDYFDDNGELLVEKLTLIQDYNIPLMIAEVRDGGGILKAGSYSFGIQYLTEDFNATNWVDVTNPVNVYRDNFNNSYREITGSCGKITSSEVLNQLFGNEECGKSIELRIIHLEKNVKNFTYFRIAIARAYSFDGNITDVIVSPPIKIDNSTPIMADYGLVYNQYFVYTGNDSGYTKIAKEELLVNKPDIEAVKCIAQFDNRLILANGRSKKIDYCNFQRYASRIKSELVTDQISINKVTAHDSKGFSYTAMGFMGGEVYAFGIVYVFKDGTISPVFHIPGRPIEDNSTGMDYYEVANSVYEPRYGISDYYGNDYLGQPLTNKNIRHHKFPSRDKQNTALIVNGSTNKKVVIPYIIVNLYPQPNTVYPIKIKVGFTKIIYLLETKKHEKVRFEKIIYVNNGDPLTGIEIYADPIDYSIGSQESAMQTISVVDSDNPEKPVPYGDIWGLNKSFDKPDENVKINILGIRFSNIQYPHPDIVGHYIVVGERDNVNRMVIDKGFVGACNIKTSDYGDGVLNRYISNFYLNNSFISDNTISPTRNIVFAKTPKILFKKENISPSKMNIEGYYQSEITQYNNTSVYEDALPGTTSKGLFFGLIKTDKDGMSFKLAYRMMRYKYMPLTNNDFYYTSNSQYYIGDNNNTKKEFTVLRSDILLPGGRIDNYENINNQDYDLINLELDSISGIMKINGGIPRYTTRKLHPYGHQYDVFYASFLTDNNNIHPDLDSIKYYKTHSSPYYRRENCEIFNGDIYICELPITHSTYYNTSTPIRLGETLSNIITYFAVILVSGILIATGVGTPLAITLLGIALTAAIGISAEVIAQIIKELEKGNMKNFVRMRDYEYFTVGYDGKLNYLKSDNFNDYNTLVDDTINYIGEVGTGLYVETDINIGLRMKARDEITSFLTSFEAVNVNNFFEKKYLFKDKERDSKSLTLKPVPDPDLYVHNPDFSRRNKEKVFFPLPITYKCNSKCLEEWHSRILWSEKSFGEERQDNYRNFLPNNYRDMPGNYGQITKIESFKDRLLIFTERMLFFLPINIEQRINNEFTTYIGTGELFSLEPMKIVDDNIGMSGTKLSNSVIKTMNSVFYIDDLSKSVNLLTENGLKNITQEGISKWFYNNCDFEIAKRFYNMYDMQYPLFDLPHLEYGIGFIVAFDMEKNRILLTKKDFDIRDEYSNELRYNFNTDTWQYKNTFGNYVNVPYSGINNNSFTIAFSLVNNKWISFYSYLPYEYIFTKNSLFSLRRNRFFGGQNLEIFKHNVKNKYNVYYNNPYPSIIDIVVPTGDLHRFTTEYIGIKTRSFKNNVEIRKNFFNRVIFYNTRQCSGYLNIRVKDSNNDNDGMWLLNQVKDNIAEILATNREGIFFINDIRDYRTNYDEPVFLTDFRNSFIQSNYFKDKEINLQTINHNKNWHELEVFRDNFLGIRFIYISFDNEIEFKTTTNVIISNLSNI